MPTSVYAVCIANEILFRFFDKERAGWVAHAHNHYYCAPSFPDRYKVKEVPYDNTKTTI